MDLGGVLSATAHLISDSAAWRVPSESDANVDVARGTLPPARWTSGANVGPPPPPRVPTLAADVGRQGGRCTSHLTPPTLPRYLGKVLPCRYIRPLLQGFGVRDLPGLIRLTESNPCVCRFQPGAAFPGRAGLFVRRSCCEMMSYIVPFGTSVRAQAVSHAFASPWYAEAVRSATTLKAL
jgi:hypothetical protein